MEKRGLCAFDNKRFLLDDGISSLAYGHHSITNKVTVDEVENPTAPLTLTHAQAVEKRLHGYNYYKAHLPNIPEESEEEAVGAGKAIRNKEFAPLAEVDGRGSEVVSATNHDCTHDSGPHHEIPESMTRSQFKRVSRNPRFSIVRRSPMMSVRSVSMIRVRSSRVRTRRTRRTSKSFR